MATMSTERAMEEEEEQRDLASDKNPEIQHIDQSQGWETMARAWLAAFPEAKAVSTSEVEVWIDSNRDSLPTDLRSMPRSDLVERLFSIQSYLRPPPSNLIQEKETSPVDLHPARFQRTDQWMPVYSWLESLDRDEAVKSKEISDWLIENPHIKEQLSSRHSRYHLTHYIKKCHLKILKRKEKKKGLLQPRKATTPKVQSTLTMKQTAIVPYNPLCNLPKDSDTYLAKRKEALRKYEILVKLEKQLAAHFANLQDGGK